jgi:hypothetical protein
MTQQTQLQTLSSCSLLGTYIFEKHGCLFCYSFCPVPWQHVMVHLLSKVPVVKLCVFMESYEKRCTSLQIPNIIQFYMWPVTNMVATQKLCTLYKWPIYWAGIRKNSCTVGSQRVGTGATICSKHLFYPSLDYPEIAVIRQTGHERPEGEYRCSSTLDHGARWGGGVGGQSHAPVALPRGKKRSTHCTGWWVGPRADLDG